MLCYNAKFSQTVALNRKSNNECIFTMTLSQGHSNNMSNVTVSLHFVKITIVLTFIPIFDVHLLVILRCLNVALYGNMIYFLVF